LLHNGYPIVRVIIKKLFLKNPVLFCNFACLFLAQQAPVGQGLLIHEVSKSHTTTHHIW